MKIKLELIHIYNVVVLCIAVIFDLFFINWNKRRKMFTKGETSFWTIAILIWTFWAYYIIIGLMF